MKVPVLLYPTLGERQQILDVLWRSEKRRCDTPFAIDPNRCDDLFEAAGVDRDAWKQFTLDHHGVSLVNPERIAIRIAHPNANDVWVDHQLERMREHAEIWGADADEWATVGFEIEEGAGQVVTADKLFEIVSETGGWGLVAVHLVVDVDELRTALEEDNEITITPSSLDDDGLMIGLYDPANGQGHMVRASGSFTFRPSLSGRLEIGTEEVLDLFGMDIAGHGTASISFEPGGPLMMSSKGDMVDRLPAPGANITWHGGSSPTPR